MKRRLRQLLTFILVLCIGINAKMINAFAEEQVDMFVCDMQDEGIENSDVSYNEDIIHETDAWDGVTKEKTYDGAYYQIIFTLEGVWENGYNAQIKIQNTGDGTIENWTLDFDYEGEIENPWNAVLMEQNQERILLKNATWNQNIQAGESVVFGFIGKENFVNFPKEYQINGSITNVSNEGYAITYDLVNDWESGFTGLLSIENTGSEIIEDWVLECDFDRTINHIWNGVIESHEDSHYVIKNAGYNSNIQAGQKIEIGFTGENGSREDIFYHCILKSYTLYDGDSMELDSDGDGLVDGIEKLFGLDCKKIDTDGDGLTDYEEINLVHTNPLEVDTDNDGILDADEDFDCDGVINKTELSLGTNPAYSDTDRDGLSDFEEINNYKSDPLIVDTDGDGLSDYDDVILGFSPLLQDTNGNGVLDPNEKVVQCLNKTFDEEEGRGITEISVSMEINGNIENNVGIVNVYEIDSLSRDVVGLVGIPVEINSTKEFDTATIQFHYDENSLGEVEEENLAILWYDEENSWYQILDRESVVDTQNNTVSLETTHFSTYMLVDKKTWYDAWRENIDYRISQEGETKKHNFDVAFVVDVSGSMRGTRIFNAKAAISQFVDALQFDDEAALISFSDYATLVSDFSSDKQKIKKGIITLSASGGTNVNSGLWKASHTFSSRNTDHEKIIVLICDGDVNYYQSTIDNCIKQNIRIYTVNVENQSSHASMQDIAKQTGGEYYYGNSALGLTTILGWIQNETIDKIDPTDIDGDGLYDIYETAGMRLPNGRVIYTNPSKRDTDGDALSDFQETGLIFCVDDRYIGFNKKMRVKYFLLRSNPTKKDSDNDGIKDADDRFPWKADSITIELKNKFSNCDYLNIVDPDGTRLNGGNQDWWESNDPSPSEKKWDIFKKDINHRIHKMGCGVVAMTDLEIYLTQQNAGYDFLPSSLSVRYNEATGEINYDTYKKCIENNSELRYRLGDPISFFTGVIPKDMDDCLSAYLRYNNSTYKNVQWAPYWLEDAKMQSIYVEGKIEQMLKKNLPVVFAYNTFSKADDELKMYIELEGAIEEKGDCDTCESHYMTIIGVIKYINENGTGYDCFLKVVSWGKIYYIRYDDYSMHMDYFCNILSID